MYSTGYSWQVLMKLESSRQIFEKLFKYQILWKSVQLEPSCSMRTDRQIDGKEEVSIKLFVILTKRPKKLSVPKSGLQFWHSTHCSRRLQRSREIEINLP